MQWWVDWKKYNSLPYAGDIGDQPAYVYEAIHVCESEAGIVQQAEREKQSKSAKEKREAAQQSQARR